MDQQAVIQGALNLNGADKKYEVTVEDDRIITTVKWMDATFFGPETVTDEVKTFRFVAKVNNDGTWLEIDESKAETKSAGKGGFGMNYSSFKGKEISFNKTIGVGQNRKDGTAGVVNITFSSQEYKKPVSDYLAACGYQKTSKGFWKSLFGK